MKFLQRALVLLVSILPGLLSGQPIQEKIDTTAISKIKDEGFSRSQVMDILSMLTDVNGPRLSYSPGYKNAAAYAKKSLESWGLSNVHFDPWGDIGKGWYVKKFHLHVTEPVYFPVVSYPKAWADRKSVV